NGLVVGDLMGRWMIADGVLEMSRAYGSLEGLDAMSYFDRVQELGVEFQDSGNPVQSSMRVIDSAPAALRYNLVMAGELQRALRRALELPEVPFPDPLGMPLTESDDGKVMNFRVDCDKIGIELSVKY
ncbi:MAG: hypothetical protein KDB61_10550, partial [Planctomycetes bacterium]|nr:hypothetical protein [Planctomycetota bacterium]